MISTLRRRAPIVEAAAPRWEPDGEMKVLLILAFVMVVAATALAYGHVDVAAGVSAMASSTQQPSEPTALLLSGGALLAVASAVRRYTV